MEKVKFTWQGKKSTDLSREELFNVIDWQNKEMEKAHKQHIRDTEMVWGK